MSVNSRTTRRPTLVLELLVPDEVVVQTQIRRLQAEDSTGRFGIHIGHERFVTVLRPGVMVFEIESGVEQFAAVDGGVLVLENNLISVACREAVVSDQVEDVADIATRMLEKRRQEERASRAEFTDLQLALLRELRKVEHRK